MAASVLLHVLGLALAGLLLSRPPSGGGEGPPLRVLLARSGTELLETDADPRPPTRRLVEEPDAAFPELPLPEIPPLGPAPEEEDDVLVSVRPEERVRVALSLPSLDAVWRPPPRVPSPPPAGRSPSPRPASATPPLVPLHAPSSYPAAARRLRLQGRVRIWVLVDPDRAVVRARVDASSGHVLLDEAALASARRWRFRPPGMYRPAYLPFLFVAD